VIKTPPLRSDETLERVLRHARSNGMGVLIVGSTFALLGATAKEIVPVMSWLLVAGTGAMTLHGASLLAHGRTRGLNWLVGSQLFCMAFILALCGWQLTHVDLSPLRAAMDAKMQESVKETGLSNDEFLLISYRLTYAFIALVTVLYQGGMALYYLRRRDAVFAAFEETD
jgi:hypothetical protein